MQRTFNFTKNRKNEWFVDLPEWKGNAAELQMVEGADLMPDLLCADCSSCRIEMSEESYAGADLLTLVQAREKGKGGGGDYLLEAYNGNTINQKIWLCAVTEFVFEQLPERIWFKRVA